MERLFAIDASISGLKSSLCAYVQQNCGSSLHGDKMPYTGTCSEAYVVFYALVVMVNRENFVFTFLLFNQSVVRLIL